MKPTVSVRSVRALRLRALAPRLLLGAVLGVLCLAGLRTTVAGPPSPARPPAVPPGPDQAAEALAESFARAYLSWDAGRPEQREAALRPYLSDSLEVDAGLVPAQGSAQSVRWTVAVAERRQGRSRTVTVAADTSSGPLFLAVPVRRDERGLLSIPSAPALVGSPPVDRSADPPDEDEVEDAALRSVAERAVGNYLAGARENLLADLTPDAAVSLPPRRLRVRSTEDVTWTQEGSRVAVSVQAEDEPGNRWSLRYELEVRRRDRWYVRSLHVDPTKTGEGNP